MYCSGWDTGEFSEWLLLNISATLTWWIGSINPKCGWCDGTMVMWLVNETTQLDLDAEWKCHVQERLATNKVSSSFLPNFSLVIADQYLFIFVKLEEDNICLFYNFTFGQTHRYVLMSLAIVKLVLVCYGQVCRYLVILTSLTTKTTRSLFIFRESEKVRKVNSKIPFSSSNPLSPKKYKTIQKGWIFD